MRTIRCVSIRVLLAAYGALALAACGKTFVEEEVPNTFELSSGTEIQVRLVDPLPPSSTPAGQTFAATLAEPLYYVRERLDPEGETFTEETLIAPIGAPVFGETVEMPEAGDAMGLRLNSITVHGGMSFPVETGIVPLPASADEETAEQSAEAATPLLFELTAPADVAMVIDYRDGEADAAN